MSTLYREPSIDASYQISSMESPLLRLLILSRSINKHGHHRPFLFLIGWFLKISETALPNEPKFNQKQESPVVAMFLTDRDVMSNLYRGLSIDASYQVSDHLAKRFQRRRIKKISQSETSRLWRPCLLMDRDEMRNIYRRMATTGHSCFWLVDF
jgi:hypothetical protein